MTGILTSVHTTDLSELSVEVRDTYLLLAFGRHIDDACVHVFLPIEGTADRLRELADDIEAQS